MRRKEKQKSCKRKNCPRYKENYRLREICEWNPNGVWINRKQVNQMTREEAIKILRSKIRTDSFDESFKEIMMDCALTMAIADMEKQIQWQNPGCCPDNAKGKEADRKCCCR